MVTADGTSWEAYSALDTFAGEVVYAVMGERSVLVGSFGPAAGEDGAQGWLGTPVGEWQRSRQWPPRRRGLAVVSPAGPPPLGR
jgi:hypothetical protein